ncbi:MAG: hypothetical protein IJ147_12290 [Lachnospiraceae bacterium]|nr:hypothetical protein [Lachnospiraceae bacterium]
MDLVEIFEVIFGAGFVILALIGTGRIFGGMFYTKRVKAVVGEKKSEVYVRINGQRYTGRYDINLAKQRDRRRHRQSGDRKKQRYKENRVDYICFTYEDDGKLRTTDPKATICPVSPTFIDGSREYNIMVSRKKPWKARLGLIEVLRVTLLPPGNILTRLIMCIIVICNALLYLAGNVGFAALGVWIITLGIK